MSKYTDPSDNFNLITQFEQAPNGKRCMGIFDMVMNRLGLPDHLHEFARAVFIAGNWDRIEGWDEISQMRMARALATDEVTMLRVYNRIKKNCPKFFKWQEKQPFTIIDRVVLHEHTGHHKTKAKYLFVLYDLIASLFNLPKKMTQAAVRKAVDTALKEFPIVEKPKRSTRRKKIESIASAVVRNIGELSDLTGSLEAAALYTIEANTEALDLDVFAKNLLQTKDLSTNIGGSVLPIFQEKDDKSREVRPHAENTESFRCKPL